MSIDYDPHVSEQMFPYLEKASEIVFPPQDAAHTPLARLRRHWKIGSDLALSHLPTSEFQHMMKLMQHMMPYYRPVPWGLCKGSEVKVEGFIPQNSKGFYAYFLRGQYKEADVPLKFELHFEEPPPSAFMKLNSRINTKWGEEKRFPSTLQQGQNFTIRFLITGSGYKIIENDRILPEFPHRIKPEYIRFLHLDGEMKLKSLVGLAK